jgi:AraC family transcriptional regulator
MRKPSPIGSHRLRQRRNDAVKNLLLTSRLTLAEVATQCGFADPSALSRSFKRVLNESPGEWRRSRKGHH